MSYIITAVVSAMIGGAVGVVTMCLCIAAGRADENEPGERG